MRRLRKRGQSTAEYAILIGVVIAALIAMQTLVGKAIKAKIYDSARYRDDDLAGTVFTTNFFGEGETTASQLTTTRAGEVREEMRSLNQGAREAGIVTRVLTNEQVGRTGSMTQTYNLDVQ